MDHEEERENTRNWIDSVQDRDYVTEENRAK